MAGLEDLTEQDGTLSLCKRLPEWTEAAGVSDVWTVNTLDTHTHTQKPFTLTSINFVLFLTA